MIFTLFLGLPSPTNSINFIGLKWSAVYQQKSTNNSKYIHNIHANLHNLLLNYVFNACFCQISLPTISTTSWQITVVVLSDIATDCQNQAAEHSVIIMRADLPTQSLPDAHHHAYNTQTYYLAESIVANSLIPDHLTHNTPHIPQPVTLGQYQPYRLSQFVDSRDAVVERGELVELAHVKDNKLVVNPYALQIFQHYEDNEISFIGNYGRPHCGKSFWYDKILNLCQFQGNNYSSNNGRQGLYFWSIPFTKGNLKFFLIDYVGFDGREILTREDQKLLDLELFLAEKFVVVPQPEDTQLAVLADAYKDLLGSQQRFSDRGVPANKFSTYWPNEIYTLYRSAKPVRKEIDNIGSLFQIYNFSILHDALPQGSSATKDDLKRSTILSPNSTHLNQKYIKMTSIVFQDIYQKMKGKSHQGVIFNGKNIPKILEQAGTSINKGQGVKIDEIFKGVRKDIAEDIVVRAKNVYIRELEFITRDSPALPFDQLVQHFERANRAAFEELDSADIDRNQKQGAEKRLREQIDAIQLKFVEDNKRKVQQYYEKTLPVRISDDTKSLNYQKLKDQFKQNKSKTGLDHDDYLIVAQRLKEIMIDEKEEEIILIGVSEKVGLENLKKKITHRQKLLNQIVAGAIRLREKKDDEEINTKQKHQALATRINTLKDDIVNHKKAVVSNSAVAEKQQVLKKLQQTHDMNQKLKLSLPDNPTKQQEIKALQQLVRRAVAKNRQHEQGLQLLDKTTGNKIGQGQSLIRDVQTENIKKVAFK